jgi:hypothetical protein
MPEQGLNLQFHGSEPCDFANSSTRQLITGATGIEPANFSVNSGALYQLSYTPLNFPNKLETGTAGNDPASSELQSDANPSQLHSQNGEDRI